ncbi:unnamed protein product [Closterium sp. NIES-53]
MGTTAARPPLVSSSSESLQSGHSKERWLGSPHSQHSRRRLLLGRFLLVGVLGRLRATATTTARLPALPRSTTLLHRGAVVHLCKELRGPLSFLHRLILQDLQVPVAKAIIPAISNWGLMASFHVRISGQPTSKGVTEILSDVNLKWP